MEDLKTRSFSFAQACGSYKKELSSKGMVFDSHCHPSYEILMVLNGKISILIEGREYSAQAGTVLVLPPFVYHSVFSSGRGEYERIDFCFEKEVIPSCIRQLFEEQVRVFPLLIEDEAAAIADRFKRVILSEERERYAPLLAAELIRLFYLVCDGETGGLRQEKSAGEDICAQIVAYINENLERQITLEALSKKLFVSKSTVCHVFQSRMKIGVKQYILQKKVSYATALMQGGMPAGEAAKRVGYENYANFYRIYKSVMGCAPGATKPKA